MFGGNVNHTPVEDWPLEVRILKFIGDEDNKENIFTKLGYFSYISIGFKYFFNNAKLIPFFR